MLSHVTISKAEFMIHFFLLHLSIFMFFALTLSRLFRSSLFPICVMLNKYMLNKICHQLPIWNVIFLWNCIKMPHIFHCQPETEFVQMNFQLNQNERINHVNFFSRQNYESGKNILLNRLSHLNGKIKKSWLELSLNSFKVKCKRLLLQAAS